MIIIRLIRAGFTDKTSDIYKGGGKHPLVSHKILRFNYSANRLNLKEIIQIEMFTLIYFQGKFNRPDTLVPFLENNVGMNPIIQIDCVTPYLGTEQDLIKDLCDYLNGMNSQIEVNHNLTMSKSSETSNEVTKINYLAVQLQVNSKQ